MNKYTSLLAIAVTASVVASVVNAAEPALKSSPVKEAKKSVAKSEMDTSKFPSQLLSVLPPNGSITKSFKAEAGLNGWVISMQNGEKMVAYTVPSGDYLIVGALVNTKGDNLTAKYTEREVPKAAVPEFNTLLSLPYIQQGNGKGKPIYIFADPYCGYCHIQEQLTELYESNGDMNVRWIQVALLSPNSGALSEAISKAPNPAAAWKAISRKKPDALTVSKPDMSDKYADESKAAAAAMRSFGGNGTPHIVWQDDKGLTQTRAGVIGIAAIADILKVPAATNAGPDLARFP